MDARNLWPSSQVAAVSHWGDVAGKVMRANGLDVVDYPLPRPFLLGIRGVRPYADETHELIDAASYDDTYVLFTADGLLPPRVFPGATHAFQRNSTASTDVNHDGIGDVGTIDPGRFVLRLAAGKYPVFVFENPDGTKLIRGHRDLDHDGVPETGGQLLTGILFHYGYDAPPDSDHKSSIGCCTASPQYVNDIAVAARGHDAVDLVIVTAEQLIAMLAPAPSSPENAA